MRTSEILKFLVDIPNIRDFNPDLEQAQDAAKIFSDTYTITACDLAIHFWEEKESYEKCAHIKKVQDLLKLNVIP